MCFASSIKAEVNTSIAGPSLVANGWNSTMFAPHHLQAWSFMAVNTETTNDSHAESNWVYALKHTIQTPFISSYNICSP
jgi:hypothetical protein